MALQHTTGPWTACKGGACQCGLIWDASERCVVAIAQGEIHLGKDCGEPDCTPTDEGQRANARLIAAAPELLDAAKLAALHFRRNSAGRNFQGDDEHEAWGALDAAIAKAEGSARLDGETQP